MPSGPPTTMALPMPMASISAVWPSAVTISGPRAMRLAKSGMCHVQHRAWMNRPAFEAWGQLQVRGAMAGGVVHRLLVDRQVAPTFAPRPRDRGLEAFEAEVAVW